MVETPVCEAVLFPTIVTAPVVVSVPVHDATQVIKAEPPAVIAGIEIDAEVKLAFPFSKILSFCAPAATAKVVAPLTVVVVELLESVTETAAAGADGNKSEAIVSPAVILFVNVCPLARVTAPIVIATGPVNVGDAENVVAPVPKLTVPALVAVVTPEPITTTGTVAVVKLIEPLAFTVTRPVKVFTVALLVFEIVPVTEVVVAAVKVFPNDNVPPAIDTAPLKVSATEANVNVPLLTVSVPHVETAVA
jgi:hypothetical protein